MCQMTNTSFEHLSKFFMPEKTPPNKQKPEDLIIRYLDGYASDLEQQQLKTWLAAAPANQQTFDEMKQIWQGANGAGILTQLDVEADWAKVDQAISHKTPRLKILRHGRAIAAGLMVFALLGSLYFYFQAETNRVQQISLHDGTRVWLAKGSQLDYPKTFATDKRTVHLVGKAFFEVVRDAKRPFVISSELTAVQVLGTSFNMIADRDYTEVIVKTGQVQLSENKNPANAIKLGVNDRGLYQDDDLSKSINNQPNYLSWKTNEFTYDGVSIEKVLQELSEHYGKPTQMAADFTPDCALVATFKNERWKTVLETLKKSCDVQIEKKNGVFILSD